MELSIRTVEIKDSAPIAKLLGQLGYASNIHSVQDRLTEIIKSRDHCVFIVEDNEKTVGWIHGFYALKVESDPFIEIGGLVVDENYRKKGIGKKLVDRIIQWAESGKCKKVRVRCNSIRKESHLFYENMGFALNKEQKVFDMQLG